MHCSHELNTVEKNTHDIAVTVYIITRESSYCFQRVLTIAILSVRLSVTRVDGQKRC